MLDIALYLERIDFDSTTMPTRRTLARLHRAHLLSVPFENLDIALGRRIELDESQFFDKIVRARRGGFCYELNGLFAALLRELGFEVTLLSARVFSGDRAGPEFDHLVLRVQLSEAWLVDVGFGDSFDEPLHLDDPGVQVRRGRSYRLVGAGDQWRVERLGDDGWRPEYGFSPQARRLGDFAGMCDYHQTSPASHFTRGTVCSRLTEDGRVTLRDRRLIVTAGDRRVERALSSDQEVASVLREYFGIELP